MHLGYNDLETIIEDEFLDQNFEYEPMHHYNYGIEFDEQYQSKSSECFEPNEAIERLHEIPDQSNFNEPAIIELKSDWEIREITVEKPFILKYLYPK